MLSGMRLGDMAAALEGRRLRRDEERERNAQETRRFHAGNVALSQILDGLNQNAERQSAQKRQAMLDKERREDRTFNRTRLRAEDTRRETEFQNKQQDRTLANLAPSLDARADEALSPDATGAWLFDGTFEGDGGVQILDAKGNATDDMVTTLMDVAKFSRAEAEGIVKGVHAGASQRQASTLAARQKAKE